MENFEARIRDLIKHIEEQKDNATSEEDVKTALVLPMLELLDYNPKNLKEIKTEYVAGIGQNQKDNRKVDYAILRGDGKPCIFIECKKLSENLDKLENVRQLRDYYSSTMLRPKYAILTDGIEYRFYTDNKEQNIMNLIPFLQFDITKIKRDQIEMLMDYRKSEIMDESKDKIRTAKIKESQILERLKKLINAQITNPEIELVKLLTIKLIDDDRTLLTPIPENDENEINKSIEKEIETFVKLTKEAFKQIIKECATRLNQSKDTTKQYTHVPVVEQTTATITKQWQYENRLTEDEKKVFEIIQSIVGNDRELKPKFKANWYITIDITTKPKQGVKKHLSNKQSTPLVALMFRDEKENKSFQTYTPQGLIYKDGTWHCRYVATPKPPYYQYTSPQDILNYKKEILEAVKKYDELNTEYIEKTQETSE
jgi:hypothetical protein